MHNRDARLEMENVLRETVPAVTVAMTNGRRPGIDSLNDLVAHVRLEPFLASFSSGSFNDLNARA
jgi:hypothetical protein